MPREMKDSGIEWIGEIPAEWEIIRFKFLHNGMNTGESIDKEYWSDDEKDIVFYTAGLLPIYTSYQDFPEWKYTNGNDLLLARNGTPYVYYPVINACYTDHIIRAEMKADINRKFVKYGLQQSISSVIVNQVSIATWSASLWNEQTIPWPPLSEQQKISAHLDSECAKIDDVISKSKATIEEYKKLKQSVITETVTKGIRPNREMKDSGIEWIGEIPKEWNVVKGTRMINSTQNGLTRRDLAESMGHIVLKLKNITSDGKISYDYINRIQLTTNEIDNYSLVDGDFLFVRVNGSKKLVGKCVIYKDNGEITAYNDHIIRVRLNNNCSKEYFYWYLYSSAGKTEIDLHTSTAAGQYTISGEGLRDICIALPRIDEQQEIADYLDQKCSEIDTLIAKKEQIVTELESYKKSLIYEYVTGKKEVI